MSSRALIQNVLLVLFVAAVVQIPTSPQLTTLLLMMSSH